MVLADEVVAEGFGFDGSGLGNWREASRASCCRGPDGVRFACIDTSKSWLWLLRSQCFRMF